MWLIPCWLFEVGGGLYNKSPNVHQNSCTPSGIVSDMWERCVGVNWVCCQHVPHTKPFTLQSHWCVGTHFTDNFFSTLAISRLLWVFFVHTFVRCIWIRWSIDLLAEIYKKTPDSWYDRLQFWWWCCFQHKNHLCTKNTVCINDVSNSSNNQHFAHISSLTRKIGTNIHNTGNMLEFSLSPSKGTAIHR